MLSLPYHIRFLCAFDPMAARGVRKILVRAVSSFYARNARKRGIEKTKAAAVVFEQRANRVFQGKHSGLVVDYARSGDPRRRQ